MVENLHMFKDFKHLAREFYSGTVFVAFDTETTGLHASSDFIMEIGAVKFTCSGEISRYDQLIHPPVPITPFLTNLTHITNEMVQDKPYAATAVPDFMRFIGDKHTMLLAHNAPFDLGFVNKELERMNWPPISCRCIDTLALARWAYPKMPELQKEGPYKLQNLASHFKIEVKAAHRADDDARVCMELFKRILKDTMSVQRDYHIHSDTNTLQNVASLQQELF